MFLSLLRAHEDSKYSFCQELEIYDFQNFCLTVGLKKKPN